MLPGLFFPVVWCVCTCNDGQLTASPFLSLQYKQKEIKPLCSSECAWSPHLQTQAWLQTEHLLGDPADSARIHLGFSASLSTTGHQRCESAQGWLFGRLAGGGVNSHLNIIYRAAAAISTKLGLSAWEHGVMVCRVSVMWTWCLMRHSHLWGFLLVQSVEVSPVASSEQALKYKERGIKITVSSFSNGCSMILRKHKSNQRFPLVYMCHLRPLYMCHWEVKPKRNGH